MFSASAATCCLTERHHLMIKQDPKSFKQTSSALSLFHRAAVFRLFCTCATGLDLEASWGLPRFTAVALKCCPAAVHSLWWDNCRRPFLPCWPFQMATPWLSPNCHLSHRVACWSWGRASGGRYSPSSLPTLLLQSLWCRRLIDSPLRLVSYWGMF